jgi:predicted nucleic acid-binding protein
MTRRFGIDTSILVRLATGDPEEGFEHCVRTLTALIEEYDSEIFASNQVIGEAYIALQHHYGVTKPETRFGLACVLQSGLVVPLYGRSVQGKSVLPQWNSIVGYASDGIVSHTQVVEDCLRVLRASR